MPSFASLSQLTELHCLSYGWYDPRQAAAEAVKAAKAATPLERWWEEVLRITRFDYHVVHLAPLGPVQLARLGPRMPEGTASLVATTATQPLFFFVGDFPSTKSYISETFELITAARFPHLEVLIYDIPNLEPDLSCPPDFCGDPNFRMIRVPACVHEEDEDSDDNDTVRSVLLLNITALTGLFAAALER